MNDLTGDIRSAWGTFSETASRRRWTEHTVLGLALFANFAGDVACALIVLRAAFFFSHGAAGDNALLPILCWLNAGLGAAIFVGTCACKNIYTREFLLDQRKQTQLLIEAWVVASIFYLSYTALFGNTLVIFPYAVLSDLVLLLCFFSWHILLQRAFRWEWVMRIMRQRLVILGWSEQTAQLARQSWEMFIYPCEVIGYVEISADSAPTIDPPSVPCLGTKEDLCAILQRHHIDAAFLAGSDFPAEDILNLARVCQTEMVEFKVIPTFFPALLSGMHVEWVCGLPILGTDRLRMNQLWIRMEKRAFDLLGAVVGLLLTGPFIAFFGLLVYLESPGPIFYRQLRLGRKGRPFQMIKIRSMRLDAEKSGQAGWTVSNDPRRLKIGAFMRRWNIDELPQFWNVFKGDMSLVGPRPERPEFISNLKHEILHYNLRHSVKPGLTGWAQVNGYRGDTDLTERIRHDLFYIDNWSLLLDVQTMFLTLFKHKNAC
jgi:exopolysaccharide biosynthesis polyprenyl glycosylphosphotransferase